MRTYLDIVRRILDRGIEKTPYRAREGQQVENTTIGLPNVIFSHEMSDGFPLLTTKKMPLRVVAVELEGFIKGITSKAWYQQRKCQIWNEWANPRAVDNRLIIWQCENASLYDDGKKLINDSLKLKKQFQEIEDDLGPIYGYQWRHFDEHYSEWTRFCWGEECVEHNGVQSGSDQLKNVVDTLKNNPTDRRMVVSAWNPNQIEEMALPPCHFCWNVVVYGDTINLWWGQRSCDLMLGVPFNIASYALLLMLLAKHSGLKPGNLTGVLADCHIYSNQFDAARSQLEREPYPLPSLEIPNNDGNSFNFWKWDHTQFILKDYQYHPLLKMEVTI